MAEVAVRELSFQYPGCQEQALREVSLTLPAGGITLLCGYSGSGKSTLLRQMKSCLAAHGTRSGQILLDGRPLEEISWQEQARRIGFVLQQPEEQLVSERVYAELAFGLENLGYPPEKIRLRVAEVATFFGIDGWFSKKVDELSGGEKQILNLAAVVAMDPEVLILDEPTSQLDPIAAAEFLQLLRKLRDELGMTILLSEHRLEEALPLADAMAVLEEGRLVAFGKPRAVMQELTEAPMAAAFPTAVRMFWAAGAAGEAPVTIGEGRAWLAAQNPRPAPRAEAEAAHGAECLRLREVCFRYTKAGRDVLDGLDLCLYAGEVYAVLGGNGTGKSTLLGILSGRLIPYAGKIFVRGERQKRLHPARQRIAALPQDPRELFVRESVREELCEMTPDAAAAAEMQRQMGLEALADRHPFDLSGGEQQKLALAKALLTDPEVLLLDEPTKGMDGSLKREFGRLLRQWRAQGKCILLVSHDIEFCADYADRCGLLFDGSLVSEAATLDFFAENRFYTTAAARICRGILPGVVRCREVEACIRG